MTACLPGLAHADLPAGIRVTGQITPATVEPGTSAVLSVTIHLPSGFIVYDLDQVPQSVLPTAIEMDASDVVAVTENFRSHGAKETIDPDFGSRVVRYFDRTPTFERPLVVSEMALPGTHQVRGRIAFLAQDIRTKRFYAINRAHFSAPLRVELTPPPTTTDSATSTAPGEITATQDAIAELLHDELDPPRPAYPPFAIHVSIANIKEEPGHERSSSIGGWGIVMLTGALGVGWALLWAPREPRLNLALR